MLTTWIRCDGCGKKIIDPEVWLVHSQECIELERVVDEAMAMMLDIIPMRGQDND